MMGDGGSLGDPYNFAQNKKSLLGKIMRLDIDNISSKYWKNVLSISLFVPFTHQVSALCFLFKCILSSMVLLA